MKLNEKISVEYHYFNKSLSMYRISFKLNFACGQSEKATVKKVANQAKRLRVRYTCEPGAVVVFVYSKKDKYRVAELLKFCNGKKLEATARNNYGR